MLRAQRACVRILVFLAPAVVLTAGVDASAQIGSPFLTITNCGKVSSNVRLGADLSTSSGDCLIARASGIIIDGDGHRISAPRFAVSWINQSDVTVRNVTSAQGIQIYGPSASRNVVENSNIGPVGIYMGDDNEIRNSRMTALAVAGLNNDPPLRTVVTGNTIEGTAGDLVHISPGGDGNLLCVESDSRIENNFIHGTALVSSRTDQALLYLRCGSHNTIAGNTLLSTGKARGIYMRDEADDNLIQDNYVWINQGPRAAFHFSSGNNDKHHPRNNVIDHNVFRADATRSLWIQSADFRNNSFTRNLFWSGASEGARIRGGTDNVFDHNTFYNVSLIDPVIVIQQDTPPGNAFTNNILVSTGFALFGTSGLFDAGGYHADYNVFWLAAALVGEAELAVFRLATRGDAHSIVADPRFVDPSTGDFRLKPGSPALTAGSDGGPAGAYGPAS